MSERAPTESVDVLVIGGGMAGSALAANLAGVGRSVVIVEAAEPSEVGAVYHSVRSTEFPPTRRTPGPRSLKRAISGASVPEKRPVGSCDFS